MKKIAIVLLLIAVTISIMPAAIEAAYTIRGYHAYGGEMLLPLYPVVGLVIYDSLKGIFTDIKTDKEN